MDTNHPMTHIAKAALPPPLDNLSAILENALGMFDPGFVLVRDQPETQVRDEMKVRHKNSG